MDPPTESGKYNVSIDGVRTFLPVFWEFDTEKGWRIDTWVNELKEGTAVWYPNK
jgi:hypothetical protein